MLIFTLFFSLASAHDNSYSKYSEYVSYYGKSEVIHYSNYDYRFYSPNYYYMKDSSYRYYSEFKPRYNYRQINCYEYYGIEHCRMDNPVSIFRVR